MRDDGKRLESLVRQIESLLLPEGFSVRGNARLHSDDGTPLAEFDIEIRGRLGSAEISWLIECRDRPSAGPAPAAWIEQLDGRRRRFGFNKVTAVSTTGFAEGATLFAKSVGIDLRSVSQLTAADVQQWLALGHINSIRTYTHFDEIKLFPLPDESDARKEALAKVLRASGSKANILRSAKTQKMISAFDLCASGATQNLEVLAKRFAESPSQGIRIIFRLSEEDQVFINTEGGEVQIVRIDAVVTRSVTETRIPLREISEYSDTTTGRIISQSAIFEVKIEELDMALEMHNLTESGETIVTLRKV